MISYVNKLGTVSVGDSNPVRIMGILNTSPESFYKKSISITKQRIVDAVNKMEEEGADFIDVGGMSTAPYLSTNVSEKVESARILNAVEDSVLIVYANNELSIINLTKEIVKRGIKAERLIFGESIPKPEYLARYRTADLFLDTHPYNAGTTASDALKMGLPLLTMKGKSFNSREAASILTSINLPELITNTPEEYEALAIELATHPEKLKAIKEKLASNLSTAPLFDTKRFTKNLESAYTQMYERNQKGLEPDHIYVEE